MITEQDLQAAIAECQGVRNPTSSTCIKLAAFYTIKNQLFPDKSIPEEVSALNYSYASEPTVEKVSYRSDTEFSDAIQGKPVDEVLAVIDELMQTISVLNPRLYAGVLRKFQ